MTILDDVMLRPTSGEIELRQQALDAQAHAESLEEALLIPDPDEFTNPVRHVAICFERQKAAHAWRKAAALQSQLNGAENRRYFRSLACWMTLGFGSEMLLKGGFTFANVVAIGKFFLGGV